MNRKYIAITLAAFMAIGIAGCGKKEEAAEVTATPVPTEAATEAPTETPVPAEAPAIYSFDGTNAEKAIVDYLANSYTRKEASSVVIPHMNILKITDKEATQEIYGAFRVCEYTLKNNILTLVDGYDADSRFTLNKNSNGTFTVAECIEVKEFTDDTELTNLCAGDTDLFDSFKNQNQHDIDTKPWPAIRGNDIAYYAYDNNLTIMSVDSESKSNVTLPKVLSSVNNSKTMYLTNDAYVRTAPDESGHAYYTLLSGAEVTVSGATETWARVSVENRTGYIAAASLTETAPSATPTPTLTPTPSPEPAATETGDEIKSVSGIVTECYSDRIVINSNGQILQYSITGDTGMTLDNIPVDSDVTIQYTIDQNNGQGVALFINVNSTPDEYEWVEVEDEPTEKPAEDNVEEHQEEEEEEVVISEEDEVPLEEDESYVEVEIE